MKDTIAEFPFLRNEETNETDLLHRAVGLSPLNLRHIKASHPGGTWYDWQLNLRAECHLKSTSSIFLFGTLKFLAFLQVLQVSLLGIADQLLIVYYPTSR